MAISDPLVRHYIGYDDQARGKYCIFKIHAATDTIIARGFDNISAAKEEAKRRGIKLNTNPYLRKRRAIKR
jgi:hypothetical protein